MLRTFGRNKKTKIAYMRSPGISYVLGGRSQKEDQKFDAAPTNVKQACAVRCLQHENGAEDFNGQSNIA
jgi:hypothetical protein